MNALIKLFVWFPLRIAFCFYPHLYPTPFTVLYSSLMFLLSFAVTYSFGTLQYDTLITLVVSFGLRPFLFPLLVIGLSVHQILSIIPWYDPFLPFLLMTIIYFNKAHNAR